MGGSYSSIEDLKNDNDLRDMIKNAIKGSIEESKEYQKTVKKVEQVSAKAQQIGSNTVNSGGHAVIGNAEKGGINITQKTNLKSVVKTLHIVNYLNAETQKNPVVQVVATDVLGLSKQDAYEKELPNWYDAKYILEMLGYRIKEARFNWNESRIEYTLDPGNDNESEGEESYYNNVKKNFETKQEEHQQHIKWNQDHKLVRELYSKRKARLDELQNELDDIYNSNASKELRQQLFEKQTQANNAQNTAMLYIELFKGNNVWQVYEENYLLENKDSKDYIFLDPTVKEAYEKIISNQIYKNTFKSINDDDVFNHAVDRYANINKFTESLSDKIFGKFIKNQAENFRNKESNESDKNHLESFVNEIKSISRITWLNLYHDDTYFRTSSNSSTSENEQLINLIDEFINKYTEYQQKVVLKGLSEISKHYYNDMEKNNKHKNSMLAWITKDSNKDINKVNYQQVWDDAKQANDNVRKAFEEASRAENEYKQIQKDYVDKHQDQKKRIEDIEKEQAAIKAELSSKEAVDAMTYYEYWDTDPIDQKLVNKLRSDYDEKKAKFEKEFMNDEETKKSQEVFRAKSRMLNAQNDQSLWKELITGSPPYMKASKILSQFFDKSGNAKIKNMLSSILARQDYKAAYIEFTKGMPSYEIEYITPGTIIANMDNDEIRKLYLDYLNALDSWNNDRLGFRQTTTYALNNLDSEYKKQNESTLETLGKNWKSYNAAVAAEANYKVEYVKLQNEYEDKYGDLFEKLAALQEEVSALYSKYSSTKSFWETYDEVVNGNFYKWRTFDELYSMLATGYTQNISEKIENFEKLTTNIIKNITESATMYATNKINIVGTFSNKINVEQTNNAIVVLKSNVQILTQQVDDVKKKLKTKPTVISESTISSDDETNDETNDDDESADSQISGSSINYWVIISVIILLLLLIVFVIMFYKRMNKHKNKRISSLIKSAK